MDRPQQAETAIEAARRALDIAGQDLGTWPDFDRSLAAACEYAVRAVTVAWGHPRASRRRLGEFLRGPLAAFINNQETAVVDTLWSYQDRNQAVPVASSTLMDSVKSIVEHLIQLAEQGPPITWDRPTYNIVGWDGLSPDEQSLMLEMRAIALRYGGLGTRVYLHGARAKGQGDDDSDYDIYVVFPDGTDRYDCAYTMSDMNDLALNKGVRTSRDWVSERIWQNPDPPHVTIVQEVKSYGIEVPAPEG